VTSYNGLIVNGYRFHTKDYGHNKSTMNSGICVRGNIYGENDLDYYGIVEEILELSYVGFENKVVILHCHWFDPVNGVKVDNVYGLVDINHKSKLQTNEPFVLAGQAQQVYYTKYPQSGSKNTSDWWAACKVRAKLFIVETLNNEEDFSNEQIAIDYFQDEESTRMITILIDNEIIQLFDAHALMEEVNMDDIQSSIENVNHDEVNNEHNEDDGFMDEEEKLDDLDDLNMELDESDEEWL